MMDIPYWSMIPAFTEGGKERENLSALARSCAGVGSALITIVTVMAVSAIGKFFAGEGAVDTEIERLGFQYFALLIAVIFVLFIMITCAAIKEKSTVNMQTASVRDMFKALIQNDQAMSTVITIVLVNIAVYTTSNLVIYFFKYDVGGESWQASYTIFNTFGGGVQILSKMLFFPLLRKVFSTMKIFYICFISAIIGYAVLLSITFTNMQNVWVLLIPGFFIFAAVGILNVLTTVFLANTVDYGELKNDRRDESVIFSMQTFVVKLASGIAAMVASVCLTVFHISKDEEAVVQIADSSVLGLRMTMTLLPIIVLIVGVSVFKKKYVLSDEKLAEISRKLEEKKKSGAGGRNNTVESRGQ